MLPGKVLYLHCMKFQYREHNAQFPIDCRFCLCDIISGATLSLAYRGSLDPDHILYELLAGSPDGHRERLKSRCPFVPATQKLLQDLTELDIRAAQWTDFKWNTEYLEYSPDLRAFILKVRTRPMGMGLPRSSWVRLNHLWAGVGCFQSFMHIWGLAPTPNCKCGAAEHIILTCPIHQAPTGICGLTVLDVDIRCWQSTITASI